MDWPDQDLFIHILLERGGGGPRKQPKKITIIMREERR